MTPQFLVKKGYDHKWYATMLDQYGRPVWRTVRSYHTEALAWGEVHKLSTPVGDFPEPLPPLPDPDVELSEDKLSGVRLREICRSKGIDPNMVMAKTVACFVFFCTLLSGWCDGPDLHQTPTITNGIFYVTVDLPACHYARWERKILPSTNWFGADSADYEFFTRKVIFSEVMVTTAECPFYRVKPIYVPWCASLNLWAVP